MQAAISEMTCIQWGGSVATRSHVVVQNKIPKYLMLMLGGMPVSVIFRDGE